MNQTIYKKIKALPPLDDTIIKIQAICTDENSSLSDLVKAVETDPMLTANILKAANSPLYGFSREVQNITRAVSLFGMATIRGFALSSVLRENIKIDLSPYDMTNAKFQEITSFQSSLMLNWYPQINRKMMDVLTPASFMMEVGKIILAHEIIENKQENDFKQAIERCSNPSDISEIEQEFLETTNEEVTARIFEQWNLEIELVESINYSNHPSDAPEHIKPYSAALKVVKNAVNIYGSLTEQNIENTLPILNENGLEHSKFLEAVHKVKQ